MPDLVPIRTAVVSVSNKNDLGPFVQGLYEINPDLAVFSTGGTAKLLQNDLPDPHCQRVVEIADYTGLPESPDDRVKSLTYQVHGGILMTERVPSHLQYMIRNGIREIELVNVNFYDFEAALAEGLPLDDIINKIDVGGPTMVRGAAKLFQDKTVVTSPGQYEEVLADMRQHNGSTSRDLRKTLARDAFRLTAETDAQIAAFMEQVILGKYDSELTQQVAE